MYEATIPSLVAREDFLLALAMPLVRRSVSALSRSPPASARARLQSMNPALVFSRSCLTSCGSISMGIVKCCGQGEKFEELTQLSTVESRRPPSGRDARHLDFFAHARF